MMQALEAGGLKVLKSEYRARFNESKRDGSYLPNPHDLYEPDFRKITPSWPREHDWCAIKVVAPFLGKLAVHHYQAVFMLRDSEEVRQSFEAAFGGRVPVERIEAVQAESLRTLRNRMDVYQVVAMNYSDVLADPVRALASLDWPIDVQKAAATIDHEKYRFRRERLVVGL